MSCCGVSKCPDTHPDILCQLCDLWYPYGGAVCKHMFQRWYQEEQEVRDLHKVYMEEKTRNGEVMSGRKKLTAVERRTVYEKLGGHCAYCGCDLAYEDMQVDHVLPFRGGVGREKLDNMLPSCRSCNHYKRGNTLEGWRKMIEKTPVTLERDCYTYHQAVKFGTVTPTPKKIVFYFERVKDSLRTEMDKA